MSTLHDSLIAPDDESSDTTHATPILALPTRHPATLH
jgi:hypothetical protein